jgi:RHS repeat-associated protein
MVYVYTADDQRLLAFDVSTETTHWTLRGLDNKVLRDFRQNGSSWSVDRDYVYRDDLLLAALKPDGSVEHYSLDHLGTPRLITNAVGAKVGYHAYWPFGEEWSPGNAQEGAPLKFTGHERDADVSGGAAPLDYMHARYYQAAWGRFLAVDPGEDSHPSLPQTWNGYAYTHNNPLGKVDSTGEAAVSYWVKLVAKDVWRRVSRDAAVRVSESGAEHAVNVIGPGASREAKAIFKDAHPGVEVIRHDAHPGPSHGPNARKPHYQAQKSGIDGHVGYDVGIMIAGFLPVVGWVADADETYADASPHVNQRAQEMYGVDFYELPVAQRAAVIASFKRSQEEKKEKDIDPATGKEKRSDTQRPKE